MPKNQSQEVNFKRSSPGRINSISPNSDFSDLRSKESVQIERGEVPKQQKKKLDDLDLNLSRSSQDVNSNKHL